MATIIENKKTLALYQEFIDLINSPLKTWTPIKLEPNVKLWSRINDYENPTLI